MNEILRAIEAEQMRNDLPNFRIGDTVKLHVKIKEGNKVRFDGDKYFKSCVPSLKHEGFNINLRG